MYTSIYNTQNEIIYENWTIAAAGALLNRDDFAGVHLDPQEHGVVLDEVPLLEHLVRHEPREAEPQGVRLLAGSLEVLPRRVRYEALDYVARLFRTRRLVEKGERDGVGEGPPQEGVVLAGQDFYVDRYVGVFACPVAVGKQRRLEEQKTIVDLDWCRSQRVMLG